MELNEKLIDLCTKNFAYYKSKYNKNFFKYVKLFLNGYRRHDR